MKKVLASLAVMGFLAANAFGGTVFFEDMVAGDGDNIVNVAAGTPAVFNVGVADTQASPFQSVTLLMGSKDGLSLAFEYDPAWVATTTAVPATPASWGVYPALAGGTDIFGGGNNSNGWTAPLLVGTLTVDTTGLADGVYLVEVDPDFEADITRLSNVQDMAGATEDIFGVGEIVIPEPAALALLGIGGLAALRRRRA